MITRLHKGFFFFVVVFFFCKCAVMIGVQINQRLFFFERGCYRKVLALLMETDVTSYGQLRRAFNIICMLLCRAVHGAAGADLRNTSQQQL